MHANRQARTTARRLFRDCVVDAQLDEARARRVVMSLIEARRRHSLTVLAQFQRFVRLDRDRHCAIVESAVPVRADVRAAILADLEHRYGRGLQASFRYDPTLIGGLRIKVGSDIYDGSIKGRLAVLEDRF